LEESSGINVYSLVSNLMLREKECVSLSGEYPGQSGFVLPFTVTVSGGFTGLTVTGEEELGGRTLGEGLKGEAPKVGNAVATLTETGDLLGAWLTGVGLVGGATDPSNADASMIDTRPLILT
jgi:hypothetical protein